MCPLQSKKSFQSWTNYIEHVQGGRYAKRPTCTRQQKSQPQSRVHTRRNLILNTSTRSVNLNRSLQVHCQQLMLTFTNTGETPCMNSVLCWDGISHSFCTQTQRWLVNYKIFRKQCILQDYIYPKLYKTDAAKHSQPVAMEMFCINTVLPFL